ncbi:MAG: prepilin-type N-terminal cleavage/methylation domain-containing protein [Terriglobales bacterium]
MKKCRAQSGFSLIEAVVVVAIILILAAVAIIQIAPTLKTTKSNAALQTTLGLLRRYHEAAVDQRRVFQISFLAPRTIQVDQVTFDSNNNQVFIFVSSIDLPKETQFLCVPGIPTSNGNTPDGLGTGQNPIDFSLDYGGGGTTVFFQKDGRSTDSAGRLNSGVVYMAQPGDLDSSKAVTVLGATGRVKGWRLFTSNGKSDWRAL